MSTGELGDVISSLVLGDPCSLLSWLRDFDDAVATPLTDNGRQRGSPHALWQLLQGSNESSLCDNRIQGIKIVGRSPSLSFLIVLLIAHLMKKKFCA